MIRILVATAAATALFAAPALAGQPKMSGTYMLSETSACAPTSDNPPYPPSQVSALVTFDSGAGTVSFTGNIVHFAGVNSYVVDPQSGSSTFSMTGTTLTIGSETYQMVFNGKKNVVTELTGVGVSVPQSGETCGDQIRLTRE